MNEITVLGLLQVLIPVGLSAAMLLVKIGRVQQDIVTTKESMGRLEMGQGELLRREVFTSEFRGLEARLQRIEERLGRLEDRVFNATQST